MSEVTERFCFWMVWRHNGNTPTYQHQDKASAVLEAQRLAKNNPGETFFVLKTTAAFVADLQPVKELKIVKDDIPF